VDSFLAALIDHLRNLLVLNACGAESGLVEVPGLPIKDLAAQAQRFNAVTLAQDVAILEELRRQARQSGAGRALLDATLVRLALAEQFTSVAEVTGKGSETAVSQKKKGEVESSEFRVQSSGKAEEPKPASPAGFDSDEGDALPAVGKVWDDGAPKLSLATIMAQAKTRETASAPAPAGNVEPVDTSDMPGVWKALLELVSKHGASLQGLLSQGRFAGVEDGRAVIRYSRSQETTVRLLERSGKRELVSEALTEVLSQPTGVKFEIDATEEAPGGVAVAVVPAQVARAAPTARMAVAVPSPAAAPEPPSVKLTPELRAELEADPLIRALIELGGSIVKVE
jgi:DNA polymerase III gamma/tau subunit